MCLPWFFQLIHLCDHVIVIGVEGLSTAMQMLLGW